MKTYSQPILRADGLSIDFLDVEYINEVELSADREAQVTNRIQGSNAGVLQSFVDDEKAEWVIEIRSPAALYSKSYRTQEEVFTVSWDTDETGGNIPVFIISSLVATQQLTIPTWILNEIWRGDEILFAPGICLARGSIFSVEPLLSSMLEFKCDDQAELGTMRLEGPNEHIKFTAYLAEDIYAEIHQRRDIWIAALIGAFSKLDPVEHDPEESRVLRELSLRLQEKEVADWCAPEDFDPAAAATCLESFLPLPIYEGE